MRTTAQLSKFLLPPQKFVNALTWKNTGSQRKVLALNITSEQVSVALTSLNSKYPRVSNPTTKRNQINYSKRNYDQLIKEIKKLTEIENIEGLVINWPIESNGRLGKSCGKVCHVLDYFAQSDIISKDMPFTLWSINNEPQQNNHFSTTSTDNVNATNHDNNCELYNRSMSFSLVPILNQMNGFRSINYGNMQLWEYNKNNDNATNNTKENSFLDATSILYDFIVHHHYNNKKQLEIETSDISYDYLVDDDDDEDDFDFSYDVTRSMLAHA